MQKVLLIATAGLIAVLLFAVVFLLQANTSQPTTTTTNLPTPTRPTDQNQLTTPMPENDTPTTINFRADGTVVRDAPGLKPHVWYIVEEKPGMPKVTTEIQFNGTVAPDLTIGERLYVEGVRLDTGAVSVIHYAMRFE